MNPLEFNWTEDQQVTVTNPTDEPYKFKVHNKEYELGAGRTAKMPGYIAWVYVYGLSSQLAQADGVFNRWNEEGFRKVYYEKLVAGVDSIVQSVEVEPEPEVTTFEDAEDEDTGDEQAAEPDEEEPAKPAGGETYTPSAAIQPMTAQPKAKALRGRTAKA